jgi:hypothetical protein
MTLHESDRFSRTHLSLSELTMNRALSVCKRVRRHELETQPSLLHDQRVVERSDTASALTLYHHYSKKRAVFSGEGARGRFEGALHVGQEDTRRDLSYSNHLITDDAAL